MKLTDANLATPTGNLQLLTTDTKLDIVSAINEIHAIASAGFPETLSTNTNTAVNGETTLTIGDPINGYGLQISNDGGGYFRTGISSGNPDNSIYGLVNCSIVGQVQLVSGNGSEFRRIWIDPTGVVGFRMLVDDSTGEGLCNSADFSAYSITNDNALASTKSVKLLINSGPQKLSTTAKNALTPTEGEQVYDITLHKLYVYDGTTWQAAW